METINKNDTLSHAEFEALVIEKFSIIKELAYDILAFSSLQMDVCESQQQTKKYREYQDIMVTIGAVCSQIDDFEDLDCYKLFKRKLDLRKCIINHINRK